ncbi:MAG: peptide chain release factor family protein [Candidatus Marinamargulisbacteria bacterium]
MSHISNEKWKLLNERMQMLGIKESELQESFIQGGGSGGQKINKTSSTVVLTYKSHQVRCKKSRNRDGNRYFARRQLCELIAEELGMPTRDQEKIHKAMKQKQRRKRKSKAKYQASEELL